MRPTVFRASSAVEVPNVLRKDFGCCRLRRITGARVPLGNVQALTRCGFKPAGFPPSLEIAYDATNLTKE